MEIITSNNSRKTKKTRPSDYLIRIKYDSKKALYHNTIKAKFDEKYSFLIQDSGKIYIAAIREREALLSDMQNNFRTHTVPKMKDGNHEVLRSDLVDLIGRYIHINTNNFDVKDCDVQKTIELRKSAASSGLKGAEYLEFYEIVPAKVVPIVAKKKSGTLGLNTVKDDFEEVNNEVKSVEETVKSN